MRHSIAGNRLGRNSTLRKATIRDLAKATLIRQRICTTKDKAKEARRLVEKLITLGKKGTLATRRKAFSILCDHGLVSKLFTTIAPRFNARMGGYTRIMNLSNRRGDNAQLTYLELTEKDKVIISKSKTEAQSKSKEAPASLPAEIGKTKAKSFVPEKETKKDRALPSDPTKSHPKKEISSPDKTKSGPKIVGGIKKIFTKKPSGS